MILLIFLGLFHAHVIEIDFGIYFESADSILIGGIYKFLSNCVLQILKELVSDPHSFVNFFRRKNYLIRVISHLRSALSFSFSFHEHRHSALEFMNLP